jgi:hypothetical protein
MIYVLTVLAYNLDHEVIGGPLGIEVVCADGCQTHVDHGTLYKM